MSSSASLTSGERGESNSLSPGAVGKNGQAGGPTSAKPPVITTGSGRRRGRSSDPGRNVVTIGVIGKNAHIAFGAADIHLINIAGEQHVFRRDELKMSAAMMLRLFTCLGRQLLALLDGFFDRSDHVERGFGQMVVFAFDEALEALMVSCRSTSLPGSR